MATTAFQRLFIVIRFRGGLKFVEGVGLFVVGVEGQEGQSGGGAGDELRH